MAVISPPQQGSPPSDTRGSHPGRPRGYRYLIVALIALVALAVGLTVALVNKDNNAATTTSSTASTAASTTASTAPTTASTTASTAPTSTLPVTPPDTSTAVWPFASSGTRYTDPVAAARGFAVDFVGFVNPVVGPFQAGDTRSGEVQIRPNATGPITTVFVRRLSGSDTWWVLGSATDNIVVSDPAALAKVTAPVHVTGTSTAFEATVNVEVREDGNRTPIGSGTVMGGSMGTMGPFDGSIAFTTPTAKYGALVFYTISAESGHVWEAGVLRVQLSS